MTAKRMPIAVMVAASAYKEFLEGGGTEEQYLNRYPGLKTWDPEYLEYILEEGRKWVAHTEEHRQ